ncbi:RimK/LysX family protein [Alcanivorax sp. JB21]|nr:RimK/LysX family protein [Alcanivorax limicola]
MAVLAGGGSAVADEADDYQASNHKVIFGLHEHARIEALEVSVEAKLDTGAVSASLSAYDINMFERDGEDWVSFRLGIDGADKDEMELPLDTTVRIRRRLADIDEETQRTYTRRPVVRLMVCIGERQVPMRVNLTDRRNFSYPLLIGSEGLRDMRSLIDPDQEFSAGQPLCSVTLGMEDEGEED